MYAIYSQQFSVVYIKRRVPSGRKLNPAYLSTSCSLLDGNRPLRSKWTHPFEMKGNFLPSLEVSKSENSNTCFLQTTAGIGIVYIHMEAMYKPYIRYYKYWLLVHNLLLTWPVVTWFRWGTEMKNTQKICTHWGNNWQYETSNYKKSSGLSFGWQLIPCLAWRVRCQGPQMDPPRCSVIFE